MSVTHLWFRSGAYLLAGHLHRPAGKTARRGALLIPPFGWEDVCAYGPLRALAQKLAGAGIAVLRFDLPATGDSSGTLRDGNLVPTWVTAIADAAEELRRTTGVREVILVGIRMGGLLAGLAAGDGTRGFDNLVLWGTPASGRSLLRELRALDILQAEEGLAPHPKTADDTFETGGFLLNGATRRALEAADLAQGPKRRPGRVLLLTCDALPIDRKLSGGFGAAGWEVTVATGHGYAAMMTYPHEAILDEDTAERIVQFTLTLPVTQEAFPSPVAVAVRESAEVERGVEERMHGIGSGADSVFAVVSEPAGFPVEQAADSWCLVFLNAGAVRHIGPNRMWVEASRRWAASGTLAARVDLPGIGEAAGTPPDTERLHGEEVRSAIARILRYLTTRYGVRRFVVSGLCSGAYWSLQTALDQEAVRGAVLINPRLLQWDPEVDRRRMLQRVSAGAGSRARWVRLLRGGFSAQQIRQAAAALAGRVRRLRQVEQIPRRYVNGMLAKLTESGTRLTLIFSEGEPLLEELEAEGYLPLAPAALITCVRAPRTGHTFRPVWSQPWLHEQMDREIGRVIEGEGLAGYRFGDARERDGAGRRSNAIAVESGY